ncbi:MAG: undecaprenyl-diphosphate phosphatase [Desulfovibrionaceae bacterium]|nr:undecaprenyl-diphosphate phosphatase [Desulfovibrionaceae bacterium]
MDNLFTAFILSFIEGLTEFLPVSSTGHLIIASNLLGFAGAKAATFNIVIQLGAILAVVVLYWPRFWGLLVPKGQGAFAGLRGLYLLFLTSLPASICGLLFGSFIKKTLFAPIPVTLALIGGAIFMLVLESRNYKIQKTSLDELTAPLALGIGCFQTLAVLWPGFSRSAATIIGGMILGCSRKLAAEYSFIAAVPIMFAATGYEMLTSFKLFSLDDIAFLGVGFVCSFIFALIAVKIFIALVSRITLRPFAIYRLCLAIAVYYFMLQG